MKVFTKQEDLAAEIDGVWVEYGEGASFKIARMGSPRNRRAYERAQAKFRSKIRRDKLTADDRIEIMARTLADSIVLDWKGLEDMEGNALEYSPEMAYKILLHDQDVRLFIADQADLAENFRQEEIQATAKKSAGGSSGKRKTASG